MSRNMRALSNILCSVLVLAGVLTAEAGAVTVQNITVSAVKTDSVKLNWDSTEAYSGWIEYGPGASYGNTTVPTGLEYWSEVDLAGLTAGTLYHYRIHAKDYLGQETVSADNTFTTRTQSEVEAAIRAARADKELPKTYYVRPDGNDAADGLSSATAWQSPAGAVARADAGDTVCLSAGTWNDEAIVFTRSGIDVAPITIAGQGDATVLNNSSGTLLAIFFNGFSYINVRDLTINNYGNACSFLNATRVNVTRVKANDITGFAMQAATGSSYVHFDQIVINKAGGHGILSYGAGRPQNHMLFTDCNITASNHNGIDIHTNNSYATVRGCRFLSVDHSAAVYSHNAGNRYIMVRDNTFPEHTGPRGVWIEGTDDSMVIGNTFTTTGTYGILIDRPVNDRFSPVYPDGQYWPGSHRIIVKDNVFQKFAEATRDVYVWNGATTTEDDLSDLLFENNSVCNVYLFQGKGIRNVTFADPPDTVTNVAITNPLESSYVTFSDNRVFTENTVNEPEYSSTKSTLLMDGFTGNYKIRVYPMTARPVSGTATVAVSTFNVTRPLGQQQVVFYASVADNSSSVDFTVKVSSWVWYEVLKDSVEFVAAHQLGADGNISFTNSAWSGTHQFSVRQVPDTEVPVISDVKVAGVTATSIRVQWTTNEPADSRIEYGKTAEYGSTTAMDATLVQAHSLEIHGLLPGRYHFRVISRDPSGNEAVSGDCTALTTGGDRPLVLPNPYIKGKSRNNKVLFVNLAAGAVLRIYTLTGEPVTTIVHSAAVEELNEEWDVSDVAGGVYFYTITAGGTTTKGKLGIIK